MLPLRAFGGALSRVALAAAIPLIACCAIGAARAGEPYEPLGAAASAAPSGWLQFCDTYARICDTKALPPLRVALDDDAWSDLKRINDWVNHTIKPETDMDHYGMIQWWRYPDDGAGACHSYALLKRRTLMQAGWPRQALLMTIVHERDGQGHAILTVATDHGDYILDNLTDEILLWSQTPYRYYMRQSQGNPNAWVWIKDGHASLPTSAIRAPSQNPPQNN
jgi:predicted transglutaminase-like cysteine proteinase